jgi:hypothetical protein
VFLSRLFSRKRSLTDGKKMELANAIAAILEVQLVMVTDAERHLQDQEGNFNKKALGYVHGCVDAIVTSKGYDMSDAEIGMPITFHVLRRLFPTEDPAKSLEYLVQNQRDEMIGVGMMAGGQQTVDFRNGKFKDSSVPMGLARFLLEAAIE